MRFELLSGLALMACVCPLVAGPYEAVIIENEVEVRGRPSYSDKIYPTGILRKGDRVEVLRPAEGDWLAIKPPPGSFSWINSRFVQLTGPKTAVVLTDDVPVRIGSEVVNVEPTVESESKLKRGVQVIVLDSKGITAADGKWLPIAPTPGEVRYIPAASVKKAVESTKEPPTLLGSAEPAEAPVPVGSASPVKDNDQQMWDAAVAAEKAGQIADAADRYLELARKTRDHNLAMRCYNRLYFLRRGMTGSTPPNYRAGRPKRASTEYNPAQLANRPTYQQGNYRLAIGQRSQYTYRQETQQTAPGVAPPAGYSQPSVSTIQPQSSGPGRLLRAPFFVDNKPTYVLESTNGMPRLYVTAESNLNLEQYVNRLVDLWGPVMYRGDLKTNYMRVRQVRLIR
ncbi:MAG: hypothetical protein KatS3mg105_0893 [Gemmatales bacterium]|nr:MAG: hypothetical protein KatS3mg105_0893 [Gemmatales bacterium]